MEKRTRMRMVVAVAVAACVAAAVPSAAAASERSLERARRAAIAGIGTGPRTATVDDGTVTAPWRGAVPASSFSFDAIHRLGANWPADPTGALGESFFLTAVNSSYAVYDLAGNAVIGPNPLETLLPIAPRARVVDPEVVYDQYDGRFVLAYAVVNERNRRSWIHLVSIPDATATDASTWCGSRVVADRTARDGSQFADPSGLGYDVDRVAVTLDMYDFARDRFRGATVLAFPKRRLYDCSRAVRFDTFTGGETRNPAGGRASSLQPAVTVGEGDALYLTSVDPGRPDSLVLWRLSGASGSMKLRRVALRIPPAKRPPLGSQGGGSVDAPDTRWDTGDLPFGSTFADLDREEVFTAHTVAKDVGVGDGYTEAVVRWYEVDPGGALASSRIVRVGVVGTPGADVGWPSLATDDSGNLFVTFNRGSAVLGEYLSAWIAEIAPGSTDAEQAPLAVGSARMEAVAGPERWGNQTAMGRDPVDGNSVVVVSQVAVSDGEGPTRDWQQTVHVVSHTP